MTPVAQTNLQLYGQLRGLGYTETDLVSVRAAYQLALRLFPDFYRACEKPFLAHLVGAASILAADRPSIALVCAGLLHSAYILGDFGTGLLGVHEAKRSRLRAAVGPEIEAIVFRYATRPWSSTAPEIARTAAALPPLDRDVVLIRLADELENLVDSGLQYHPDAEHRLQDLALALPAWSATARALGQEHLASRLEEAQAQAALPGLSVARALRSDHDRSFHMPPASLRPRWTTTLRRLGDRIASFRRGVAGRLR